MGLAVRLALLDGAERALFLEYPVRTREYHVSHPMGTRDYPMGTA
jgi:hypothetical protein